MSAIRSRTDLAFVASASAPKPIYLAETPVLDVMIEQLEYLVAHGGRCMPYCPDCRRLEQLKRCLLQPFTERASVKAMVA